MACMACRRGRIFSKLPFTALSSQLVRRGINDEFECFAIPQSAPDFLCLSVCLDDCPYGRMLGANTCSEPRHGAAGSRNALLLLHDQHFARLKSGEWAIQWFCRRIRASPSHREHIRSAARASRTVRARAVRSHGVPAGSLRAPEGPRLDRSRHELVVRSMQATARPPTCDW